MQTFISDDAGYRTWIATNPSGFVLNCHRNPLSSYLMLHRATCKWIASPNIQNYTTTDFIKVCSLDPRDLGAWSHARTGGSLKPCGACRPAAPLAGGQATFLGLPDQPPGPVVPRHDPISARPTSELDGGGSIALPSGLRFTGAEARLLRFCREEYAYYDGIADTDPDRVLPVDVLATIAMNSFIDKAVQVRRIHRGLAANCDPLLPAIPVDADLLTFDPELTRFERLIHAAVQAPEVLVPRAVKVLHRKRRNFIPMLDTVVLNHYLDATGRSALKERTQDKRYAASVATAVLRCFREDLRHASAVIADLRAHLAAEGFDLTPVRILEILIWTETEPQGYYRK